MDTLTKQDHAGVGEIVAFAKFRPLTESHQIRANCEQEIADICERKEAMRRVREAEQIRQAAPTHQGVSPFVMDDASEQVSTYRFPRLLREAFPHEAEPVLYLDNSLLAKCLRAFSRLFGRT